MSPLKVLFVGGTGTISSACSALALERGIELYLLTRGESSRPLPVGARLLKGDIHDPGSVREAIGSLEFDVVVDWVAFTPEHIERDISLFSKITAQYIFISSASAYQTPPRSLPVNESTPLRNPFWAYSRAKIACEVVLMAEYRENAFPVTIVRPSHTYDRTMVPFDGGWTVVERMRQGRGVVVPGDGTSLWTMTHHEDFAVGFVGLLGRTEAIGESFHITADSALTWNHIYTTMAHAAGVEPDLIHVPSDAVFALDREWGSALLGDKSHSMIFDNSKIKRLVPEFTARIPFESGAREIVAWHDANPHRKTIDSNLDLVMDKLVQAYRPRPL